ncbi:MAG: glycosyltransferase family 39 protein [Chloroflexi bacterium]|nr:glycosyltransferase family 39 protein [Chloroflexota bacterium]
MTSLQKAKNLTAETRRKRGDFLLNFSAFPPRLRGAIPLPELLVLAVAAFTRFWRLDYHSFWFDEIVSLDWASYPPAEIWEIGFHLVREKHPPGYYLTLHFWQQFLASFGLQQNDVALRALGSLFGVLTVLGVLLLATRLSGRATGLLAALFVALSPGLVWYSQELRMFQPAATAIVWATYFLVAALPSPIRYSLFAIRYSPFPIPHSALRIPHWIGLILALTYALYSYLFAAFFLPGLGLSLLVLAWKRWRLLAEGMAALGITGLLFLPLARNAWLINDAESPRMAAFDGFGENLWRQMQVFTLWRADWDDWAVTGGVLLFALLALAGFLGSGPGERRVGLLLALWSFPPLLIAGLLQATNANIFKEERYYLFLAPFVLWAAARAVTSLTCRWRWLGWSSVAVTGTLLAAALPVLWTPGMLREDWRVAAAYIADYQEQSPGLSAGGVAHVNYLRPAVEWYLGQRTGLGNLPVFGLFGGPLTPEQMEDVIGPPLQGIETAMNAQTLWLLQSHLAGVDDQGLVQRWLDDHYPLVTEQYPAGIKLRGYALRTRYTDLPPLAENALYPGVEVAPAIQLTACEVVTPRVAARDVRMHPPSGWVHLRLWLRATGPVRADYQPSARIVDAQGVWGELLPLSNGALERFPTTSWTTGELMRVEMDVNLNPETPPGSYEAVVGFDQGQERLCGAVEIM